MQQEGSGDAEMRDDQVQSAVQFLTHPKVQASSLDDRRKFLVKKGLTEAEIDEAMRLAQPQLQQTISPFPAHPAGGAGMNGAVAAGAKSKPPPGVFAEPAAAPSADVKPSVPRPPSRLPLASGGPEHAALAQQPRPPVPPTEKYGWGRVVLASMAVAGVGGGLGLLARKVLRGDGDYLTSSEGGGLFGAGGGRERAASAAEARQQAAAAAVAMAELTTKVEKTSQSVDSIMTALQRIQTSSEVSTRALERMEDRLRALESKPSVDSCKAEILNACHTAINQNSMAELRNDISSLRGALLSLAASTGGSVDISTSLSTPLRDAGSHSNLSQVANTPADASAGGNAGAAGAAPGLGIDVSKPPPGLPNARIFRKLNQSSVAASPSASSIAVSAPALSNPTLEASDASNASVERNGGATVGLPSALEQHLHANGVQVSASPPGWDGHNSGQGAGKEMVGEGAASGTSGSWLESLKEQQEQEQEKHGCQIGSSPPYSATFKEVMTMVRAGTLPPDVQTVDDRPLISTQQGGAAESNVAAASGDMTAPRAKPWERNLSGNKPTQPAPVQKVGQIGSGVIENGSAIVHTPSAADKVEETSLGSMGLPVTAPSFRPSTVASLSAVSKELAPDLDEKRPQRGSGEPARPTDRLHDAGDVPGELAALSS